jgi:hypothetical protein
MVEVFSTNVCEKPIADLLVFQIEQRFGNYRANFDLEDCDHILRIKPIEGTVNTESIINFVAGFGYRIEVLPDIIVPVRRVPGPNEDPRPDFRYSSSIAKNF